MIFLFIYCFERQDIFQVYFRAAWHISFIYYIYLILYFIYINLSKKTLSYNKKCSVAANSLSSRRPWPILQKIKIF